MSPTPWRSRSSESHGNARTDGGASPGGHGRALRRRMISFGIDIGSTTIRAAAVTLDVGPFAQQRAQVLPGSVLCVRTPYAADRSLLEREIVALLQDWAAGAQLGAPDVG